MIQMIDISCNCGADLARNVVILETADARRITAALSEHCLICCDRRSHPEPQVECNPDLSGACANVQTSSISKSGVPFPESEVCHVSS